MGSINIGNYQLENLFGTASNFPFGSLSAYSTSDGLNYRYLKPEFTLSKEVGLDLSFLNNRINTTLTFYQTNTTNQTVDMSVSRASGYSSSKINAGEMLNRGFEVELKTTPVSTADWSGIFHLTMHTGIVKFFHLQATFRKYRLEELLMQFLAMLIPITRLQGSTRILRAV